MLFRALALLAVVLVMPIQARAAQYLVRPGDTLGSIAQRYNVSVSALASANGITNVNLVQSGRFLTIPAAAAPTGEVSGWYQVRWGDTLLGLAAGYHTTVAAIRALNPSLGVYPLAGQWLRLCQSCAGSVASAPATAATSGATYTVQPGDTLTAIASRYAVSVSSIISTNQIADPNTIVIGAQLTIPAAGATVSLDSSSSDSSSARSLIELYAQQYGVAPSLALAVGWQESGFNQGALSATGAIGVMQVEPYTGAHISTLLGRGFDLYNLDDNIHAGVFWLAHLLWYYGGNERLAVAAYYQGTRSLARYGYFQDTVQYVNNVLALQASFGG